MASPVGGIDPEVLKGLLAAAGQFGPSEADQKTARNLGLLTFGLNALANVRKPTLMGLGEAGMAGVGGYQQGLQTQLAQRQANIKQAMDMYQLDRQVKMMNMGMGMMQGDQPGAAQPIPPQAQVPGTGLPSLPPSSFGAQGQTPGGMAGAFGAGGQQPAPATPINAPQYAPSAAPGAGSPFPSWRQTVPMGPLGMVVASGDMKEAGKQMIEAGKLTIGRNGEMMMGNKLVGRAQGEGTLVYPGGDISRAYFIPTPPEALAAAVNQAGATAGATAAAQAQYKPFPYPIGGGQTQVMSEADAMARARQDAATRGAPPQPTPAPPSGGASPYSIASKFDRQGVPVDIMQSPSGKITSRDVGAGLPGLGGPGITPSPIAMKAAEAEAGKTGELLGDYAGAVHQAAASSDMQDARLNEMGKLMQYFKPGKTMPLRTDIAGYGLDLGTAGKPLTWLVPNAASAVPAAQAFTKIGTTMVADMSKFMGSREAAQVVFMLQGAFPNVGQVDGAPQSIMSFMRGLNAYQKDTEQGMAKWRTDHGGSLNGFQETWRQEHPVTSYIPPLEELARIQGGLSPKGTAAAPQQSAVPTAATVVKTGTYNGKKVVQYSDGTVDYAK